MRANADVITSILKACSECLVAVELKCQSQAIELKQLRAKKTWVNTSNKLDVLLRDARGGGGKEWWG